MIRRRIKLPYMITNLLPPMKATDYEVYDGTSYQESNNGSDGWSTGYPAITVNSNLSLSHGYIDTKNPVKMIKGHTYYLRWSFIANTNQYKKVTCESYWPNTQTPAMITNVSIKNNNRYQVNSCSVIRNNWDTGEYKLRFGIDNGAGKSFEFAMSNPILIDLTDTFGSNFPTLDDLNKKNYFSGSIPLIDWINHPVTLMMAAPPSFLAPDEDIME